MGVPIGYHVALLPRNFLNLFSFQVFIRNLILDLLRHVGLTGILEPAAARTDSSESSRLTRPGPIPASVIEEILPLAKFSEVAGGETPERCAVCLYDFEGEEEIRRLRNCRHIFHRWCLDRWMEHDRMTCPLCRTPVVPAAMQEGLSERPWADVYAEYLPIPNLL